MYACWRRRCPVGEMAAMSLGNGARNGKISGGFFFVCLFFAITKLASQDYLT